MDFQYVRVRRGVWNVKLDGRSVGTLTLGAQDGRAGWRLGDGTFYPNAADAALALVEMLETRAA